MRLTIDRGAIGGRSRAATGSGVAFEEATRRIEMRIPGATLASVAFDPEGEQVRAELILAGGVNFDLVAAAAVVIASIRASFGSLRGVRVDIYGERDDQTLALLFP